MTLNLHAALLQLRDHGVERVIWADAVCINQDDERGKEGQIRLLIGYLGKTLVTRAIIETANRNAYYRKDLLKLLMHGYKDEADLELKRLMETYLEMD